MAGAKLAPACVSVNRIFALDNQGLFSFVVQILLEGWTLIQLNAVEIVIQHTVAENFHPRLLMRIIHLPKVIVHVTLHRTHKHGATLGHNQDLACGAHLFATGGGAQGIQLPIACVVLGEIVQDIMR